MSDSLPDSLAGPLSASAQLTTHLPAQCGPSMAASQLLATFAAFAALACAVRIRQRTGASWFGWAAATTIALGGAAWSTQLVGVMSCRIGAGTAFDQRLIALSAIVVLVTTGAGIAVAAADPSGPCRLLGGGLLTGAGWSLSFFVAMAALRTTATIDYDGALAALSVVINIGTATVLCWVAFHLTGRGRVAVASVLLGAAIRGGHFTALAAARLNPDPTRRWATGIDPFALGLLTAAGATIVLMFIVVAAVGGEMYPHFAGRRAGTRPISATGATFRTGTGTGAGAGTGTSAGTGPGTGTGTGTSAGTGPGALAGVWAEVGGAASATARGAATAAAGGGGDGAIEEAAARAGGPLPPDRTSQPRYPAEPTVRITGPVVMIDPWAVPLPRRGHVADALGEPDLLVSRRERRDDPGATTRPLPAPARMPPTRPRW
jgi:NO-binding membrane sensor protein with MHYT domain